MYFQQLMLALPLVGGIFTAAAEKLPRRDGIENGISEETGTARYMIEVDKGTDIEAFAAQFASKPKTRVVKTFNTAVFSGITLETELENIDTLKQYKLATNVWKSNLVKLPTITKSDSNFLDIITASNFSVHQWTGVDKAHAAGMYGKGAVVAVVDTGTDYNHPALGGGFGPGYKVSGGWDLVGDGEWPYEPLNPDADVMDNLGHGTHVAGIVAGKSDDLIGVAPEATLLSYKVMGVYDYTTTDVLAEAFLMAYEAGADIITCSIGGQSGWAEDPWAVVADRLVAEGVVVTIAYGNSGLAGAFVGGNGASGKGVIAVASIESGDIPGYGFTVNLTAPDGASLVAQMAYLPRSDNGVLQEPFQVKDEIPILPLFLDDQCSPLPEGTPDLSNVLVIIEYERKCQVSIMHQQLVDYGARYVLLYASDIPSDYPYSWYAPDSYLGVMLPENAAAIIDNFKKGGSGTSKFLASPQKIGYLSPYGGRANAFTSIGPSWDLDIKPDIAAPGGSIYSTWPGGLYQTLSGTSMATPYVAGIAALYVSQFGGRKVHGPGFATKLLQRITSTGSSVPWFVSEQGYPQPVNDFLAPVPQVGNGMIDAWKLLNYSTSLSFKRWALNDTLHFSRYQSAEITNSGKEPVTYTFRVEAAGAFEVIPDPEINFWGSAGMTLLQDMQNVPVKIIPKVKFPSGKFTVKPGETKKAEFIFEIPTGGNQTNVPLYSGKVIFSGSNGQELSVPYFGVAADIKRQSRERFWDWDTPTAYVGQEWATWKERSNWTFDFVTMDYPRLTTVHKWGTRELRWDIFDANWKERDWVHPPVVGKNGYLGSVAYWSHSADGIIPVPGSPESEEVLPFPVVNLPRNMPIQDFWYTENKFTWLGQFTNGSKIVPGQYKMRFAALEPFGVPTRADNWVVFDTPKFTVLPPL